MMSDRTLRWQERNEQKESKEEEEEPEEEAFEERPLGNILDQFEGKSGVYFIAPEIHRNDEFLVKIGMSKSVIDDDNPSKRKGGLGRRLDSYLLCYPRGYYLFAVLQTTAKNAYPLEKFIHQYLLGKGLKTRYDHSHSEEWFRLTLRQLNNFIPQIIQQFATTNHKLYLPNGQFVESTGRQARQKNALTPARKTDFERDIPSAQVLQTLPRFRPSMDMDTDEKTMRQPNFYD